MMLRRRDVLRWFGVGAHQRPQETAV